MRPFSQVILVAISGLLLSGTVVAQVPDYNEAIEGSYQATGFSDMREYQRGAVNETVDPYSGSLKRVYTDYVFPGNGGMNIEIVRYYQNLNNYTSGHRDANSVGGEGPMGTGWDIHFGRIWVKNDTSQSGEKILSEIDPSNRGCRIFNVASGSSPTLEMPGGGRQVLIDNYFGFASSSTGSSLITHKPAFITPDHWLGVCLDFSDDLGDGGIVMYSPDGRQYVFNKLAKVVSPGHSIWDRFAYVPTRITDINDNYMDITYTTLNLGTVTLDVIDTVTTSEGVSVQFNYNASLGRLSSITGEGITLLYNHEDDDFDPLKKILRSVVIAGELVWEYDYYDGLSSDGKFSIKKATSPFGQDVEYIYQSKKFTSQAPSGQSYFDDNLDNIIVSERTVEGEGVWKYTYAPATGASNPVTGDGPTDITTVTLNDISISPLPGGFQDMCIQYEHLGEAALPPGQPPQANINHRLYRRGLLIKKQTYGHVNCLNDLLETEIYEYRKKALIGEMNEYRPLPLTVAENTWKALMTKKTIVRDGVVYITENSYDPPAPSLPWAYDYDEDVSRTMPCGTNPETNDCANMVLSNPVFAITESTQGGPSRTTSFAPGVLINEDAVDRLRYRRVTLAETMVLDDTFERLYGYDARANKVADYQYGNTTFYAYSTEGDMSETTDRDNCPGWSGTLSNGCDDPTPVGVTYLNNYYRGRPQDIVMPDGTTLTQVIDGRGNVTSRKVSDYLDTESATTVYQYDDLNRVTNIFTPEAGDNDITIDYLNDGMDTEVTMTRGNLVEKTVYDERGNVKEQIREDLQGDSIYQNFSFDDLNNPIFSSYPSYSAGETEGVTTDFDELGRMLSTTYSGASGTSTLYDHSGGLTVIITDERGFDTRYTYEAYGSPGARYLATIEQQKDASNFITTQLNKNALGRLNSMTQGGLTRSLLYYSWKPDQLEKESHPVEGEVKYERNFAGQVTEIRYNNETLSEIKYEYDAMHRLARIDARPPTDDIYFYYDHFGNIETAVKGINPGTTSTYSACIQSLPGSTHDICRGQYGKNIDNWDWSTVPVYHEYSYTDNNQLYSEFLVSQPDNIWFYYDYLYDQNGNLEAAYYDSPTNWVILYYINDALGRQRSLQLFDDINGDKWIVTNANYHPNGQLHTMSAGNGQTYTITQTARLRPDVFTVSGNILSLDYNYDPLGNITGVSGDITLSGFEYDGLSRLNKVTGSWGEYIFSYDDAGNITTQTIPSVGQLTYNYSINPLMDDRLELTSITGAESYTFSYSAEGNMLSDGQQTYSWDNAGRMIAVTGASYGYDAHNRRYKKERNSKTIGAAYGLNGKLLSEMDIESWNGGDGNETHYFYFNGQLVMRMDSCGVDTGDELNRCPTRLINSEGSFLAAVRIEDLVTGQFIGMTAQGLDGAATYSLLEDCNGAFTINSQTGEITVADDSLLEAGSCFLKVEATNSAGAKGLTTFVVQLMAVDGIYAGSNLRKDSDK